MHQRHLLERAFTEAAGGLRRDLDRETRAAVVDASPEQAWEAIVQWLRRTETKRHSALVTAIWESGDPLLRLNLIRHLDPTFPDELRWLTRLVNVSRAGEEARELYAIALKRHPALCAAVLRKKDLHASLRTAVEHCLPDPGGARAAAE
jgi:hypothetical protein